MTLEKHCQQEPLQLAYGKQLIASGQQLVAQVQLQGREEIVEKSIQ